MLPDPKPQNMIAAAAVMIWWLPLWMDRSVPTIGVEVTPTPLRSTVPAPP